MNMNTIPIHASSLIDIALDWAVATCEGYTDFCPDTEKLMPPNREYGWVELCSLISTDWETAGHIIEREKIQLEPHTWFKDNYWLACVRAENGKVFRCTGETCSLAAMRAYVMSKMGDYVEIPESLC